MMRHKNEPTKDIYCHNCGFPLEHEENFCPYCGQKNDKRRLSIKMFWQNLVGNFFNFDSRIWHTFIQLIKKPGKVPKEFIEGKKIRYSNPFRFIIQVSIVYFLLLGLTEWLNIDKINDDFFSVNHNVRIGGDKMEYKREQNVDYYKKIDSINQEKNFIQKLSNDNLSIRDKDSISEQILTPLGLKSMRFVTGKFISDADIILKKYNMYLSQHGVKNYTFIPKIDVDEFNKSDFFKKLSLTFSYLGFKMYNQLNEKELFEKFGIKPTFENKMAVIIPYRFYNTLYNTDKQKQYKKNFVSNITIALFFVLPVFTFFAWLFYRKSGYNYTETLIFVFYLQSVYFLLLIVELIPYVGIVVSLFSGMAFLIYLILAYKFFYKKSFINSFIKVIFLIVPTYMIITGIGILVLSFITLIN